MMDSNCVLFASYNLRLYERRKFCIALRGAEWYPNNLKTDYSDPEAQLMSDLHQTGITT